MTHQDLTARTPIRVPVTARTRRLDGALPPDPRPTLDIASLRRTIPSLDDPGLIERFTDIVRQADDATLERFLADLLHQDNPAEAIFLDLLAPTAARLGKLWEEDRCHFVEVTVAVGRLQRVLRSLSQTLLHHRAETQVGTALLACLPGEQHTLGMFMVAEFFAKAGFDVTIGPPLDERALLNAVAASPFDVVGLSIACGRHLDDARRLIRVVRRRSANPRVRILVGGFAIQQEPDRLADLGADGTARDAQEAVEVALATR